MLFQWKLKPSISPYKNDDALVAPLIISYGSYVLVAAFNKLARVIIQYIIFGKCFSSSREY